MFSDVAIERGPRRGPRARHRLSLGGPTDRLDERGEVAGITSDTRNHGRRANRASPSSVICRVLAH